MDSSQTDFSFDESKPTIIGHLLIRDPATGEVILDRRDRPVTNILSGSAHADRND